MEKILPKEIEANNYPSNVIVPSLSVAGISVNTPAEPEKDKNLSSADSGEKLVKNSIQSINFSTVLSGSLAGWRLGSDGKFEAYNAIIVPSSNPTAQSSPADPSTTTSTTGLMMGLAGSYTPFQSGRVLIMISGDIDNNTVADGSQVQIRYGTGTAPANGAALTGTTAGGLVKMTNGVTDTPRMPFSLNAIVSSLTVGTAYWVDVGLAAVTGGTARIRNLSVSIIEI